MLLDECPIAIERKILVDATLKQRSPRSRVDDRGPKATQIVDAALDDIDGLDVGLGEEFPVHVLANDADPDSVERPLVGEASIGLRRQPADAESGQLILRIVAGDRFKHAGRILDGAAQRSHARIQCSADHSDATDEFLRWRQSYQAVVPRWVMDGAPGLLSDRARHQVRGDR
jgi:hypothetical protein